MKVVINACCGGFSLSPLAVKRLAELNGRECYFFIHHSNHVVDWETTVPCTIEEAGRAFVYFAYDIPDAHLKLSYSKKWIELTDEERKKHNEEYSKHCLADRDIDRNDPKLVQVVEELGDKANGQCAKLKIVEIPDTVKFVIEEYDGYEHVAEEHQTWS